MKNDFLHYVAEEDQFILSLREVYADTITYRFNIFINCTHLTLKYYCFFNTILELFSFK